MVAVGSDDWIDKLKQFVIIDKSDHDASTHGHV
jgi:hypothetical protein